MNIRRVYKGKVIDLSLKSLALPDGGTVLSEVVGHPGAVLVAPFLKNGSLVMIRQYRPVIGRYIYEFPAGTRRRGEPYRSCAERELAEETGLRSRAFTRLGEIYPVPGYSTEKMAGPRAVDNYLLRVIYPVPGYSTEKIVIYRAGSCLKGERRRERDEFMENVPATAKEAAALFRRGGITDAKTICALAFLGII